jgi:hypothetical protein
MQLADIYIHIRDLARPQVPAMECSAEGFGQSGWVGSHQSFIHKINFIQNANRPQIYGKMTRHL